MHPAPAASLYGPPASGKSHLAQIWAGAAGASVIAAAELRQAPLGAVVVEDIDAAADRLFALLLDVCSGTRTWGELMGESAESVIRVGGSL